jgi:hypothetical protein
MVCAGSAANSGWARTSAVTWAAGTPREAATSSILRL